MLVSSAVLLTDGQVASSWGNGGQIEVFLTASNTYYQALVFESASRRARQGEEQTFRQAGGKKL